MAACGDVAAVGIIEDKSCSTNGEVEKETMLSGVIRMLNKAKGPTRVFVTCFVPVLLGVACAGVKGHETTTQKTDDMLPQREPDVKGILTSIERFSPRTENCVDRSDLPPNQPISSDDPPSCTQLPTNMVGTMLLEEDPDSEWGGEKVHLTVTTDTLLFVESEGVYAQIAFDDLERGHTLVAWVAGPIAESYPSQANASVVVVSL